MIVFYNKQFKQNSYHSRRPLEHRVNRSEPTGSSGFSPKFRSGSSLKFLKNSIRFSRSELYDTNTTNTDRLIHLQKASFSESLTKWTDCMASVLSFLISVTPFSIGLTFRVNEVLPLKSEYNLIQSRIKNKFNKKIRNSEKGQKKRLV